MTTLSYTVPVAGTDLNSVADPEISTALNSVLTWANGNVDNTNVSNTFAQSVGSNTGTQTVKGATNISASQSTSSTTYVTLATPDQVTGIVLPTNGLIVVWYQATWQESVAGAARAAIFVGSNQLKVPTAAANITQAAATNTATAAQNYPLFSFAEGLACYPFASGFVYGGDVTTGQVVGGTIPRGAPENNPVVELGSSIQSLPSSGTGGFAGGPCYIFAAAGTYTVSVQFKASSGSVTASSRKLWVQALSFS